MRLGVISDTHGLLRPEARQALRGVDLIIHAGDAGSPAILDALGELAPVQAVRGNVDRGPWAQALPATRVVEAEGALLFVLHDLAALDLDPGAAGFGAVISGHTHQPRLERRGGVLFLNPGSAGPRRFNYPISVGLVRVGQGQIEVELVEL